MAKPDPFLLLRLLSGSFKLTRGELQARLEPHGVYAGQDYLLEQLWIEDGLTVGEIAEQLRIEVPTVVRTVRRMEATGLVRKEPDPDDRRRSRIVLTERGRAIEPEVRAALADVAKLATKGFTKQEREQLTALLERVRANLRRA